MGVRVERIKLTVTLSSALPREAAAELMESLIAVGRYVRNALNVYIDIDVREVAGCFPTPHTFHEFHGHLLDCETVKVEASVEGEESSDAVSEALYLIKKALVLPEGLGVGMSWVGVADAA
ncbi:hypothetical protein Igni_0310 [Ignicoccus hospitalis KIN4/I]|uniref:Uncharacterized protein n=1 Tax=Ignicoccus hospitalis (strain KIN4/I / DSM 18386 / JCM 14125) TaxID=453591 RepID=A8A991_IGNH4|nr:hypothetical protein Igni_0310 [Ignicoccus hospitalis KIN4/I]